MIEAQALAGVVGKEADLLALIAVAQTAVAVVALGWIALLSRDGPGCSWARVLLFVVAFLGFFAVSFGVALCLYGRLSSDLVRLGDAALPDPRTLYAVTPLYLLAAVLGGFMLRRGGFGRRFRPAPVREGAPEKPGPRIGFEAR